MGGYGAIRNGLNITGHSTDYSFVLGVDYYRIAYIPVNYKDDVDYNYYTRVFGMSTKL